MRDGLEIADVFCDGESHFLAQYWQTLSHHQQRQELGAVRRILADRCNPLQNVAKFHGKSGGRGNFVGGFETFWLMTKGSNALRG
jgi:hypothetical protein